MRDFADRMAIYEISERLRLYNRVPASSWTLGEWSVDRAADGDIESQLA
jgi:hypothetical protein